MRYGAPCKTHLVEALQTRCGYSGTGENMIKRSLPWDGLGHQVVAHGGVLYIGGVVAEDTSLDMAG